MSRHAYDDDFDWRVWMVEWSVGKTHVLMGDDARAYLDFSMAIDLDDEDSTLYYERSWCLRR